MLSLRKHRVLSNTFDASALACSYRHCHPRPIAPHGQTGGGAYASDAARRALDAASVISRIS